MKLLVRKTGCIGLFTLSIAISTGLLAQTPAQPDQVKPAATAQTEEKLVDINTADAETLERQLEGIGPKKATAIVEFREKNGFFKSLSDLEQVYGIGKKTLARNQDKIKIVIPAATEVTTQEPSSPPAKQTVSKEGSPAPTTVTNQTATPTTEVHSAQ
ncbi:competence protein ComEA helix-hairpin-helix repeat protein [Thioploca ingrica]|uniref:Competence protein ComEA helix-hairpin-helix repeat protein n=1 Tax=Thioploca ingrica TaxID=40754 RepID=A0A090ANJ0_9GAMM|nr:competence protein ComEA helix-hairpin-helix repeat protein [Thioploca ingrica]